MNIIINSKNLKRALGMAERVVSKNITLPVLNSILFKTENGRLKISATNLEIGINYSIGAKIEEVGQIAIPARILSDLINNIDEEKINISTKNSILNIITDHYKTQILAADPKDFPIIPKVKGDPICSISSQKLKEALVSVFDSTSISESRPELAGVFMSLSKGKLVVAATDTFRLAEKIIEIKNETEKSFILPRNAAGELIRICGETEGDLDVYINENQICFSNNDFEIISRLVDGDYPDYKKVVPDKYKSRAMLVKDDLEKRIKLAGLFSSNIFDIKISCQKDKTLISGRNSDKGEIDTEIDSMLRNEPFELSLNFRYLLDGLKAINNPKILLEFTGTASPVILRPAEDKPDSLYLIMPLRK